MEEMEGKNREILQLNEKLKTMGEDYEEHNRNAQERLIETHRLDIQRIVSESKNAIDQM